jgi:aspartate racemase
MGPEATAYFFSLVIKLTEAVKDQDHISVIIDNNPRIPERTAAILGKGPSPARPLLESARRLARAGADFIVIPCVTAHAFLPWVEARAPVPFVNLIEETLSHARRRIPGLQRAGLLASTGTIKSGLFSRAFARAGVEIIVPTVREQEKVMEAVFGGRGIKAGFSSGLPRKLILDVSRRLISRGAQAIIAGCTEIPLALREEDLSVPLVEPMRIAAEASVLKAGYALRKAEKPGSRRVKPRKS